MQSSSVSSHGELTPITCFIFTDVRDFVHKLHLIHLIQVWVFDGLVLRLTLWSLHDLIKVLHSFRMYSIHLIKMQESWSWCQNRVGDPQALFTWKKHGILKQYTLNWGSLRSASSHGEINIGNIIMLINVWDFVHKSHLIHLSESMDFRPTSRTIFTRLKYWNPCIGVKPRRWPAIVM